MTQHPGRSTIVNVSSASGLLPLCFGTAGYATSKGGLITFSKALAHEMASQVRVNVVCPGTVNTPLLPDAIRAAAQANAANTRGRIAEASEIALAILFLTSSESSYITGTATAVDNGRTFH